MSAYTTKDVTREEAIELIFRCQNKYVGRIETGLSDNELEKMLDRYAYSGEYEDILGCLYNFNVVNNNPL